MHSKSQEVLQKLLQVEAKKTAYRLGLRKVSSPEPLSYEFVRRAIGTLEGLANLNDEKSRTEFIAISALLWTLAADTYQGIRDHLVVLLAKIGYSPSSSMLNNSANSIESNVSELEPLHSLLFELETCAYDRRCTIDALGHSFLVTEFQKKVWDKIGSSVVLGISAPTSAGKSFILALGSLSRAIDNNLDILYIVPTLSLVNQVTSDYASLVNKFTEEPSRTIPQLICRLP